MTGSETSPTNPAEFLRWWISHHIGTGSQLSDAALFAESMVADAASAGIDEDELSKAAGLPLKDAVEAAIKRAIEEGLL